MPLVAAAITGDGLVTQDGDLQHKIWIDGAELKRAEEDIFKGMEGSGPEALIETEMTTNRGKGMSAIYPQIGEFGDVPHQGGDRFSADEDFEEIIVGHDGVKADFHRWATSGDDRAEEIMGMRGQLFNRINELHGRRVGKFHCHHALMCALHLPDFTGQNRKNPENVANPKGVTSQANILSTDTLSWQGIVRLQALMDPLGGMPFSSGRDANGNEIRSRMVIPTAAAAVGLNLDPEFIAYQKEAGDRGATNNLWAGGFPRVRGNIIREWNVIDQPGEVKVGSPLNPKAFLGTAITATDNALFITGGRNATAAAKTKKKWFEDFPLYAYPFQKGVTLSWTAPIGWQLSDDDTFFVTVVNPPNGADADKWCIYEVSANDGNKLTCVKRLGPTDSHSGSDIQYATVGNVTWNSTRNTQAHPSGALIYLSTPTGTPLGATPMFGACGLRRAWGKYKMALMKNLDTIEAGFIQEHYVVTVFGHAPRRDLGGAVPGITVLRHAIEYEGWNHPRPTSLTEFAS